jgi:hypothetical protein
MSTPTVQSPKSPGSGSPQRDLHERIADTRLEVLVRSARFGRRLRVWRSKTRRTKQGLAQGELLVAFTNEEDARSRALAAIWLAVGKTERLGDVRLIGVRPAAPPLPQERPVPPRWRTKKLTEDEPYVRRGLTRSYAGVLTPPGLENVIRRAITLAAWRYRLPASRRGLVVQHSPVVVPAHAATPLGDVVFSAEYTAAKKFVGADNVDATGVTIMIIDNDIPDVGRLRPDLRKRVTVRPPHRNVRDGHATLMTAIVGDIARGANIIAVALREPGATSEGAFTLIDVLSHDEEGVDLIVASVSFAQGTETRAERGRDDYFVRAFTERRYLPRRPPALFPTGNVQEEKDRDSLAVPARFETTIGIGSAAVAPGGRLMRRSAGSRYGPKDGDDPFAWWLAPGGTFRRVGDIDPFVIVGVDEHAGTSVANAFAGGMLAAVIRRLRKSQSPSARAPKKVREVEDILLETRDSERSQIALDRLGTVAAETITYDALVRECARLAHKEDKVEGYAAREHGDGLLCLE